MYLFRVDIIFAFSVTGGNILCEQAFRLVGENASEETTTCTCYLWIACGNLLYKPFFSGKLLNWQKMNAKHNWIFNWQVYMEELSIFSRKQTTSFIISLTTAAVEVVTFNQKFNENCYCAKD